MKNKYIISLFTFLLGFITCFAVFKPNAPWSTGDITQNSGLPEKIIKELSLEWMKKAKICNLGYYKIAVPEDGKSHSYYLWTEKGPVISSLDELGLNIYDQNPQNDSYKIIVTLQDRGKGGFFNQIDYRTLDNSGRPSGNITDVNMDGQPDLKYFDFDKDKKKGQVWIDSGWHELDNKDGQRGIFYKDKFMPVKLKESGWQLKK